MSISRRDGSLKVLAIGAHPDDIEIGCGGTLLHQIKAYNAKIHALVLTDGGASNAAKSIGNIKVCQQQESFARMGIEGRYGNLIDRVVHLRGAITVIEGAIEQIEPDYIFTHYKDDTHQDHRTVAEATISAARNHQNLLFYEGYSTQSFQPNLYVDISGVYPEKMEVLGLYEEEDRQMDILGFVSKLTMFRSHRLGCGFAEAFMSSKLQIWSQ